VHGGVLGLIGMGRIGQAVARRGRGFGMRVLYHSRTRLPAEVEAELGAAPVELDALLAQADFVSVHLPLTAATRGYIGARELARMRPEAILINTARGPIVDQEALIAALGERRLAGAGLDVFATEPALDPRLLELPGTVLLPHIGSASVGTRRRMCMLAAGAVVELAQGAVPQHVVNRKG
jgi:lactate dehydrogenase-like 2-hydroxyacid dehydrogenase